MLVVSTALRCMWSLARGLFLLGCVVGMKLYSRIVIIFYSQNVHNICVYITQILTDFFTKHF